uniref:Uncharacterized protein n=1 Tax=Anguilla anguilla TaxID=7936 RepID=A0A0E9QNV8_ANGAN
MEQAHTAVFRQDCGVQLRREGIHDSESHCDPKFSHHLQSSR